MPKISIAIPYSTMKNHVYFLRRLLDSIAMQTFIDYEVVITQEGTMPENSNAVMRKCKGEFIKLMYMDDFFSSPNSLQEIVDNLDESTHWLVSGCSHTRDGVERISPHYAEWNDEIKNGINTIGSPSVLTIRNRGHLEFDELFTWVLDCDLYMRYHKRYGLPKILNTLNVVIGLGEHQMTNLLNEELKLKEIEELKKRYV